MEILYKGVQARSLQCCRSQRIQETCNDSPIAFEHSVSNCPDKAVLSDSAMRIRCQSSHADVIFSKSTLDFSVTRFSFVAASKLTMLCYAIIARKANTPLQKWRFPVIPTLSILEIFSSFVEDTIVTSQIKLTTTDNNRLKKMSNVGSVAQSTHACCLLNSNHLLNTLYFAFPKNFISFMLIYVWKKG